MNRETASRHLGPSKPAIPPPGSEGVDPTPNPAMRIAGSHAVRRSLCGVHRTEITVAIEQGLSAQWIYQDMVASHAFAGSYISVKRFVHRLRSSQQLLFAAGRVNPVRKLRSISGRVNICWIAPSQI